MDTIRQVPAAAAMNNFFIIINLSLTKSYSTGQRFIMLKKELCKNELCYKKRKNHASFVMHHFKAMTTPPLPA
jgi:hypothetical protein